MNIIKRNGEEVQYTGDRIISAVSKTNAEAPEEERKKSSGYLYACC